MQQDPDSGHSLDGELARRFALLRDADAQLAPAAPDAEVLGRRVPLVPPNRFAGAMPGLAAVVVLVLVTGLLTLDTSPRDPGGLYADIMRESPLMTDFLLSVSPQMSPEMTDTLGAFDMDLSVMELN